jgi:hypothetical protein
MWRDAEAAVWLFEVSQDQIRFDSIWRRIKGDDYAAKLEGQFRESRDRLGLLNNWGSLAWLYPHATATKLAHHYGLEHNARHFLDGDEDRDRYRTSFRIASHVMHWGHLPLSYAGAEGVIRAAHIDEKSAKALEGIFEDVIKFGSLRCADEDHYEDCAGSVLSGEDPFELYKWLSAWLLSRRWKKVWKAVKGLSSSPLDEEETKQKAIRALVCKEDAGYELLDLCRLADYVPRDLQQAGTAWLTIDIEALWETSPLRSDRAQEWNLLEAASNYLEDRFFLSPEAQLVHSLAARAIAQGMLNKGLTRENLLLLLEGARGDDRYGSFFTEYHRGRLHGVRTTATSGNLHRLWTHVGTFKRVRISKMTRLQAEDLFTGKTGSARLSYPLTSNFHVLVRPERRALVEPGGNEDQVVSVALHHRHEGDPNPARPALDIAMEARRRQGRQPRSDVQAGVASWLSKERIDIRDEAVRSAAGRALLKDEADVRKLAAEMSKLSALSSERDFGGLGRWLASLSRRPRLPAYGLGRVALGLPLGVARSKNGRKLLEGLTQRALEEAATGQGESRGFALEAAVAAAELNSDDPCEQRMLIIGATALASEGQAIGEWDVLRIDLIKGGDWRIVAVECSLSYSGKKEAEDQEKLETLRMALNKRFSDLCEYRTRLAFLEGGSLKYDDPGRGFVRT